MSRLAEVDIHYTSCSLHTAHCAPIIDSHDFSNTLRIFLWNPMHSFSMFSQRLVTETDGL